MAFSVLDTVLKPLYIKSSPLCFYEVNTVIAHIINEEGTEKLSNFPKVAQP